MDVRFEVQWTEIQSRLVEARQALASAILAEYSDRHTRTDAIKQARESLFDAESEQSALSRRITHTVLAESFS